MQAGKTEFKQGIETSYLNEKKWGMGTGCLKDAEGYG